MNARDRDDEAAHLLAMVNANWMTQAIGVAAHLGLADALAERPAQASDLAARTGCDADALERLLRGLASLGVCAQAPDGRYALTSMGALLRRDAMPSIRSWAIYTALHSWSLWGRLADCVRTGQSARKLASGGEGYAHLDADPATAAVFNRAMEEVTHLVAGAVAREGRFEGAHQVVDVGGGHGEMLAVILAKHPHLQGMVCDLPHAAAGARRLLADAGLEARASFVAASFFESIPAGADTYVMKSIVHNWDDERSVAILRRVREAAPAGARVLLVERVLPERLDGSEVERATLRSDINMLVGLGGRERTEAQMAGLLAQAGFTVRRCVPVGFAFSVIEGA